MAFTDWKATPLCFFRACRHRGHSMHFRALAFSLSVIVSPFMDCCEPGNFPPRYQFSGLTAFVEARGSGRNAPEASAGFPVGHEEPRAFPPKDAGGASPPHRRRNQRLMILRLRRSPPRPPGHGFTRPLGFTPFQRAKLLPSPLIVALFNPGSGAFSGSARSCAQ